MTRIDRWRQLGFAVLAALRAEPQLQGISVNDRLLRSRLLREFCRLRLTLKYGLSISPPTVGAAICGRSTEG